MSNTSPEPSNWELSRGVNRLEGAINGMAARLEAKIDGLPSKADHDGLKDRVDKLEVKADKRSDKASTQWLMWGTTIFTSLIAIVLCVVTIMAAK